MIIKTMKTHPEPNRVQSDNTQVEELYNFGGELVYIADGKIHRVTPETLMMYPALSGFYKGEGGYEPNCSGVIATRSFNRRHLEKIDDWLVPVLRGVIDVPLLRPDWSLLIHPGYDETTGLYLSGDWSHLVDIPRDPSAQQVLDAVHVLCRPFKDFEFRSKVDRAVHLAALLTTAQRPILSTTPAFAYTSEECNTGKTSLAQAVESLASGTVLPPMSASPDDYEMRKRLFNSLREGQKVILHDNVSGDFDSLALSAFLTDMSFHFRVLSKNTPLEMPNTAMVILAGNNLEFRGDLGRRVLTCHLGLRNDYARSSDLDPVQYVQDNRQELVAAVLTILRGYLWYNTQKSPDTLRSCDDWSLIRGAVQWLGDEGMLDVGDPGQSIKPVSAHDDL